MAFEVKRNWTYLPALVLSASLPLACSARTDDSSPNSEEELAFQQLEQVPYKHACDPSAAKPGTAHCLAKMRIDASGQVVAAASPPAGALGAMDLEAAYDIPADGGAGKIVAIVDAQDDPKAEHDLAVYRHAYGLPPCTTANGCFKKVNQKGHASPLPEVDDGWAGEISLDLDMVSAACPECKILLVEADTASDTDLGAAVNTAVALGATVVSNSYGGTEEDGSIPASQSDEQFFTHPGVAIFASSGDSGFDVPDPRSAQGGASFPASASRVIGVGGTTLVKSSNSRGWVEKAWSSAGSGCSHTIAKPAWQNDAKCDHKTVADISAVASNLAVFDTQNDTGQGADGWVVFGGTSASSPLVAAIYAKTGHGADTGEQVWKDATGFFDVTRGSNGSCSAKYLCTAKKGYDGPTGWGTPNG